MNSWAKRALARDANDSALFQRLYASAWYKRWIEPHSFSIGLAVCVAVMLVLTAADWLANGAHAL